MHSAWQYPSERYYDAEKTVAVATTHERKQLKSSLYTGVLRIGVGMELQPTYAKPGAPRVPKI